MDGESWPYIVCQYKDKIKRNKRVDSETKNKIQKILDEGKSYKEMLNIMGLENNRRSRYLWESVKYKKRAS